MPFRSSMSSSSRGANTPSSSDAQSVRSEASDWTTGSTAETVTDVAEDAENLSVSLHPLASHDGLIVKITPPISPLKPVDHVPCDIVLVIDVSGSMGADAPIPTEKGQQAENHGLSVLDLVKHAARTILSTLNEGDRLGIVTFAAKTTVLQGLTVMDVLNKKTAERNIASMQPVDATNLWHGILEGVKLFKQGGETGTGRVPAIMVLTDGMPNYMCPPQGYVPKIRGMEQLPATIHTFGFGYSLRSGLLKSIAEIGGGNYAFIPDAGMIGTVFVHAVANLQATYATSATLRLVYPASIYLEETTGDSVEKQEALTLLDEPDEPKQLSIALGNLQYGQTRDIYLRVKGETSEKLTISASLEYSRMSNTVHKKSTSQDISQTTTLPDAEVAYHISRSEICAFLSSIIPIRADGEHVALDLVSPSVVEQLDSLVKNIPAQQYSEDPKNKSLLEDLTGQEPKGQITLALTEAKYYRKWGIHYLPSLLNAHTRQICNTFKDSGPLQYGSENPLFISCRDKLDTAFDNLPAPTASNKHRATHHGHYSMSAYNRSAGVCFAASTEVLLASGQQVPIRKLTRGVKVQTLAGSRCVESVLKTPVKDEVMCRIGQVVVTPWHPVNMKSNDWCFPADVANPSVRYTGYIYSILLEADPDSAAHSLYLEGGIVGVTLGHGVKNEQDIRAHDFFGSYRAISAGLKKLGVNGKTGVVVGNGVLRDAVTGRVCGFKKGPSDMARKRRATRVNKAVSTRVIQTASLAAT